jgi:hypothetical protein
MSRCSSPSCDWPTAACKIDTAVSAVELLDATTIRAVASRTPTFEFFRSAGAWDPISERFRLHALATQRAAGLIAEELGCANRDSLVVASTLHDIGQLALIHAYHGYHRQNSPGHGHAAAAHPS